MKQPDFIVVVDTNVWIYQTRGMRTPHARSLLNAIATGGGALGLPHVCELELHKNARKYGSELVRKTRQHLEALDMLADRPTRPLPTADRFGAAIKKRLEVLQDLIVQVPFTFDHANEALRRVVHDFPPSRPDNKQFQDTAIWLALLDLGATAPVYFVTRDKGFFEDREPANGLAHVLAADITALAHPVVVYYTMEQCLEKLNAGVPEFNLSRFATPANEALETLFDEIAAERNLHLGAVIGIEGTTYGLDDPQKRAVTFTLTREASLIPDGELSSETGVLVASASGLADLRDDTLQQVRPDRVEFRNARNEKVFGYVYAYTSDSIRVSDHVTVVRAT